MDGRYSPDSPYDPNQATRRRRERRRASKVVRVGQEVPLQIGEEISPPPVQDDGQEAEPGYGV